MSAAVTTTGVVPSFPQTAITDAIQAWWFEETGSGSTLSDPFAKTKEVGGTVFDVQPTMDSLRAVTVLLTLEEIVPFELPDELIKLGGYDSLTEMIDHLVPQVGILWRKHVDKDAT